MSPKLPSSIVDLMRRLFGHRAPTSRPPVIISQKPPTPPPGPGDIDLSFVVMDGIAGNGRRGRSLIWFAPNKVQPGDHLKYGALFRKSDGAEVPCVLLDLGFRHIINGQEQGVLGYIMEADGDQPADLTVIPGYTYKHVAPTLPRLTPLGVQRYNNPLPVEISPRNKATISIEAGVTPFTMYFSDEDFCRRVTANLDCAIGYPSFTSPTSFTWGATPGATGYKKIDVVLIIRSDMTARMQPWANPTNVTAVVNAAFYAINDNVGSNFLSHYYPGTVDPWQNVGYASIYVPASMAFTLGTTPLDTPGIIVTTQNGTVKPYSLVPRRGPQACWVPRGKVYNCTSEFFIDVIATEETYAAKGLTPTLDFARMSCGSLWRLEGVGSPLDITALYAPTLTQLELFATLDKIRFYRHAVHYDQLYRDEVLGSSSPLAPNGWNKNEPESDVTGHLVDYALTGDASFLPYTTHMAYNNDRNQIVQLGTSLIRSGSGRRGKHTLFAMPWYERLGLNSASTAGVLAGGKGTYVMVNNDWQGLCNSDFTSLEPDHLLLKNGESNYVRWRRTAEFMSHWMRTDADATHAANVGLQYLNLTDYQTDGIVSHGVGPFMQGFALSEMTLGFRVWGEPAWAAGFIEMAERFMFEGVSPQTGQPEYGNFPGEERFMYSAGTTLVAGGTDKFNVQLNGTHGRALAFIIEHKTGADQALWKARAKTITLSMATTGNVSGNVPYHLLKTPSEIILHVERLAEVL